MVVLSYFLLNMLICAVNLLTAEICGKAYDGGRVYQVGLHGHMIRCSTEW